MNEEKGRKVKRERERGGEERRVKKGKRTKWRGKWVRDRSIEEKERG